MMQIARMLGAGLPIFCTLILIGCSNDLTEAERHFNAGLKLQEERQLGKALVEYNEALLADPQFGEAYANKAIAYTYLEKDGEAQLNIELAMQHGVDRAELIKVICPWAELEILCLLLSAD